MGHIGSEAIFLDAPCDPDLERLFRHWNAVRASRTMPTPQDIDLSAITNLLPYIFIYKISSDLRSYVVHFVGQELVRFVGGDLRGRRAGSAMPQYAAGLISQILDVVAAKRAPKFRAGKTHWHKDKPHHSFEACFLPLSSDGKTVNVILAGMTLA